MRRLEIESAPPLRTDDTVSTGVAALLDTGMPALPVVDSEGVLAGIFGEREFMEALFPGYVGQLGYAGFVPDRLDEALEKRAACAQERISDHMNTEHVAVDEGVSDIGLAEMFLHHRVLAIPVERDGQPVGIVTRAAFFQRLGEAFLDRM